MDAARTDPLSLHAQSIETRHDVTLQLSGAGLDGIAFEPARRDLLELFT